MTKDRCSEEYKEFVEFLDAVGVEYVEVDNIIAFVVPDGFSYLVEKLFGDVECMRIYWRDKVGLATFL